MTVKVVRSERLSRPYDTRYEVVNGVTGEILDDAQGYGYKNIKGAYSAWNFKHKDQDKEEKKQQRRASAKKWLKEHTEVADMFDWRAWDIMKGLDGLDAKIDTKLVKQILKENKLSINAEKFSTFDLLQVLKGKR